MSDSDSDEYGPALPPGFASKKKSESSSSDEDAYGPALPSKPQTTSKPKAAIGARLPSQDSSDSDSDSSSDSDSGMSKSKRQKLIGPSVPENMISKSKSGESVSKDSDHIGPVLPAHLKHLESAVVDNSAEQQSDDSDSDDGMIGPSVSLQATGRERTSAAEFEMRAQKMHAKLTGQTEDKDAAASTARESWMTELPSAMGKQFGLANRTFRKNEAAEMDSSWTDTPQEREKKEKERSESGSKRKKAADHYVPTEKDRRMEKEIEEYNKSHRPDSLLAMHEKKLKKKKKKEKKKKKKKDKKPEERRPFDRDVDLQVNRLDEAQRKAIIKRSQELNSRFKTGGMGTSFL